jgi:hypothetical protein
MTPSIDAPADVIPPLPSRQPADHGLRAGIDWAAVSADLHGLHVVRAPRERKPLSRDFYWYSPIRAPASTTAWPTSS